MYRAPPAIGTLPTHALMHKGELGSHSALWWLAAILLLAASIRVAWVLLVPNAQYSDSVWYDGAALPKQRGHTRAPAARPGVADRLDGTRAAGQLDPACSDRSLVVDRNP